uniref:Uncharacterized protein n=1 Tax=Romanomermis culicivorax TaxID=13658 RepID=A0A915J9T6_ROMCU
MRAMRKQEEEEDNIAWELLCKSTRKEHAFCMETRCTSLAVVYATDGCDTNLPTVSHEELNALQNFVLNVL